MHLRKIFIFSLLAEILIFILSFIEGANSWSEVFKLAARYSGRFSLFFFSSFFIFISLNWSKRRNQLLVQFYYLSGVFAVLHLIHFCFLVVNLNLNDIRLVPLRLTGGIICYLLIVAYPFLLKFKNPPFWIDFLYFYFVLLVMAITIKGRIDGSFQGSETSILHYLGLIAIAGSVILHIFMLQKNKRRLG
jgi:hypothetical protein